MMNSGADPTDSGRHNSTPSSSSSSSHAHATSTYKHKAKQKSLQVIVTEHHFPSDGRGGQHDGEGPHVDHNAGEQEDEEDNDEDEDRETVGSLLADIANAISDSLRMLMFADKRHWASDEFEQVRALEDTLDEAKADFQELGPLLKGNFYYENDRRPESLDELRELRALFIYHGQTFKDWLRQGGPINPLWARDTFDLRRDLHRAQRRAAARIFASQQADIAGGGSGNRCLGAFEVYRRQRRLDDRRKEYGLGRRASRYESTRDEIARDVKTRVTTTTTMMGPKKERPPSWKQNTPTMSSLGVAGEVMEMGTIDLRSDGEEEPERDHHQQQQQQQQQQQYGQQSDTEEQRDGRRSSLVDLVPACNSVGRFERFGDRDIAFSCDFCDGFIVWEDLHSMPSALDPLPVASGVTEQPNWQARGTSLSAGEDKTVVFAPLAIANHISPDIGDWQARILCPYCDDYNYYEAGDEDETRYVQDEKGFGSLRAFQEHLEWYHTSVAVPSLQAATKNCVVM